MHVATDADARAGRRRGAAPPRSARLRPGAGVGGALLSRPPATLLALGFLVLAAAASLADGLLWRIVAYERDTAVFYYPLSVWIREQLLAGHLPLWAPHVFGGYPIFADGELGLAYPPMLLALLVAPADLALVLMRLLHLSLAGGGAYALARLWGLPQLPAVLAGLTFSLGSFLQAQIHQLGPRRQPCKRWHK